MNILILMGNLGRDPEMRYTPQGKAVTNFSIAINRGSGENRSTLWVKCVAWERTAEFAAEYLRKGMRVIVEGWLDEEEWTEKESNKRISRPRCNVRNITIADRREREEREEREDDLKEELTGLPF